MRALVAIALVCCIGLVHSQPIPPAFKNQDAAQASKPQGTQTQKVIPLATVIQPAPRYSAENNPQHEEEPSRVTRFLHGLESWFFRMVEDPIALFTLVLALYTVRLWSATERLATGADKSSRQELRAYVAVAGFAIEDGCLVILHQNNGKTPAQFLHIKGMAQWTEDGKATKVEFDSPRGDLHAWNAPVAFNTLIQARRIQDRMPQVSGTIEYVDVFGDKWKLHFSATIGMSGPAIKTTRKDNDGNYEEKGA